MAQSARLILLGLIMETRCGGGANAGVQRMTTHTQQIHLILVEHALVSGAMWGMAGGATFDLGFMLINKWSLLIGVALITNFVRSRSHAQLVLVKAAMRIVAIVTLNQPFVDSVMKWTSELCADV